MKFWKYMERMGMNDIEKGTLYLVPTPIGNLLDMTERALTILRGADIIAAEDTRHTGLLLQHFDIDGKLFAYHEHNKEGAGRKLIAALQEGKTVAQCSDAGMPVISDPGAELVRLALDAGIPVVPLPGPNAALTALIASGLDARQFTFIGFLPKTAVKKRELLSVVRNLPMTLIFYEAPHRLKESLKSLRASLGNRNIVLARELTKRFETFSRGTFDDFLLKLEEETPRGEYVILVERSKGEVAEESLEIDWKEEALVLAQSLPIKEVSRKISVKRHLSRRKVYQYLLDANERDV